MYLFLEEACELAQAAALHLARFLGIRLELGLHVVKLGNRRRGIQLFEQTAPALQNRFGDSGHTYSCIVNSSKCRCDKRVVQGHQGPAPHVNM